MVVQCCPIIAPYCSWWFGAVCALLGLGQQLPHFLVVVHVVKCSLSVESSLVVEVVLTDSVLAQTFPQFWISDSAQVYLLCNMYLGLDNLICSVLCFMPVWEVCLFLLFSVLQKYSHTHTGPFFTFCCLPTLNEK